jgi:hypothetical protein
MTPSIRKLALTAHVTSSVGWLGSIGGFLALAVAGLRSQDAQTVRAASLAAELITWWVIIPLAFVSLLTGLIMSLGTPWGLFRHYWVLAKLLITLLATGLLLLHTRPIGLLADIARETGTLSGPQVRQLQTQLVRDAVLAMLALLVNVTLSVFKPQGVTGYGRRKQREQRERRDTSQAVATALSDGTAPRWAKVFAIIALVFIVWFIVLHLTGRGLHGHGG